MIYLEISDLVYILFNLDLSFYSERSVSIKNKQRISTAQDLDGILNVESEQRNALAAVSR